jgi:hypothetical protein
MAKRPVFISEKDTLGVKILEIEFQWYPGMSVKQKQRSIDDLHKRVNEHGYKKILEISSKSLEPLGVELSAFNLKTTSIKNSFEFTVETAFQSSKIFESGGPYRDLLSKTPREAKMDPRIRNSGKIIGFRFFGIDFPTTPLTFFYDWLYINVLIKNNSLCNKIVEYEAFTDIEFNPEKSINCQAFSAALFVSMVRNRINYENIRDPKVFSQITKDIYIKRDNGYQKKMI